MGKTTNNIILYIILTFFSIFNGHSINANENSYLSLSNNFHLPSESTSIKNINGKLYAYIVLLFNENPHFVNLIQKDSIPLKIMGIEGFHLREYKNYLKTLRNKMLKKLASTLLLIYIEPSAFNIKKLQKVERELFRKNIILKFSIDKNYSLSKIILDYCIYGKKNLINIKHPLLAMKENIYNIQPFLYYDEFSTSNSTFYFDMIYINRGEVHNDYIIAKKIITGYSVKSMFFVGSRVTKNIKYCLKKAFKNNKDIKKKIWEMFVIHELTHKYLNNRYNFYDQVTGEELSLCSTIYSNPYLGLSVLYSYLNYNSINPHRIAAENFIRFIAGKAEYTEFIDNPGLLKFMKENEIRELSKVYFYKVLEKPVFKNKNKPES